MENRKCLHAIGMTTAWIACAAGASLAGAEDPYPRAGYRAVFTEPGFHDSMGSATILDERTIRVDHFTFDGGGITVYFYLGADNTSPSFQSGIPIGPELTGTPRNDESITVQLPEGQSLDGYNAISVWCVPAGANFASATFEPPYARADQQMDLATYAHAVEGTAIILDERTVHLEHFTYDGPAIEVYFILGVDTSYSAFTNGQIIGTELVRDYVDESVTVQRPEGETLDGFGALSVWCVPAGADFGSGTWLRPAADFDIDGDVDQDDVDAFEGCASGPAVPVAAGCEDKDFDDDGDADHADWSVVQQCFSGEGKAAGPNCPTS